MKEAFLPGQELEQSSHEDVPTIELREQLAAFIGLRNQILEALNSTTLSDSERNKYTSEVSALSKDIEHMELELDSRSGSDQENVFAKALRETTVGADGEQLDLAA